MSTNDLTMPESKAPTANITFGNNIFSGSQQFALAQRMSQALASSTVVPKDYQGNIGNCLIALEMANRLNTSPLMVMQNLYIVNGRPAWSSQYIIAMINSSKKYKTELQFHIENIGTDAMSCYAWVEDHSGHKVTGPTISMEMARKEGWIDRNGSKWKTMPEVMIRYRAASFFGRLNCSDMIMGIYSTDEVIELGPDDYREVPIQAAEQELKTKSNQEAQPLDFGVDPDTGEVLPEEDSPAEEPVEDDTSKQVTLGPDF